MRIIEVKLNYTTEAEYYRMLGLLMVVQKLLNDYLIKSKEEEIEPESFAERWVQDFELDEEAQDEVINMFICSLLVISRSSK